MGRGLIVILLRVIKGIFGCFISIKIVSRQSYHNPLIHRWKILYGPLDSDYYRCGIIATTGNCVCRTWCMPSKKEIDFLCNFVCFLFIQRFVSLEICLLIVMLVCHEPIGMPGILNCSLKTRFDKVAKQYAKSIFNIISFLLYSDENFVA